MGNIVQGAITIVLSEDMKAIAGIQAQIQEDNALATFFNYEMDATNANMTSANTNDSANVSGIAAGEALVSQSAATTEMEFPA